MRIGIIGTGRIAARFADTALTGIESTYISCVYNPREESAVRSYSSIIYRRVQPIGMSLWIILMLHM